ncbi:MAG: nucleoside-diphosphate sugar epimerase/dehydratase, partial [Bradyrhizobium sp.]
MATSAKERFLRLPRLSGRQLLIVAHDLIMTVVALVATFVVRFEGVELTRRVDGLERLLPGLVLYAAGVYFAFGLYKAKWRFASIPDLMNIFRAATVLAVSLLILDYVLVAPTFLGRFFFGKITIAVYWCLQMFCLGGPRIAYRYFRYSRTRHHALEADSVPTLILGRAEDADVLLRAIESGAVKKIRAVGILSPSPADHGQSLRGVAVLGGFGDLERTVGDLAERGTMIGRLVLTPSALDPEAKPETILMRARRLGIAAHRLPSLDDGREELRLAPVAVEDLL